MGVCQGSWVEYPRSKQKRTHNNLWQYADLFRALFYNSPLKLQYSLSFPRALVSM